MKRIKWLLLALFPLFIFSCNKDLELQPNNKVSQGKILESVEGLDVALNGVYRTLYSAADEHLFTSFNVAQWIGIRNFSLNGDLMGTDVYFTETGNGWFVADYTLNVINRQNGGFAPHGFWNYCSTVVANINIIINNLDKVEGDEAAKNRIKGACLALRAYFWHYQALCFCSHVQHYPDDPGIPMYLDPITEDTEGASRGTVKQTYEQIKKDIDEAVELLENHKGKENKIYVDYYTAQAIRSMIYMHMGDYAGALESAQAVIDSKQFEPLTAKDLEKKVVDEEEGTEREYFGGGLQSAEHKSLVWGIQIEEKEATGPYVSLWGHFAETGEYFKRCRKRIHPKLYNYISINDFRKRWWHEEVAKEAESGMPASHAVTKYLALNKEKGTGVLYFIRYEEVLLNAAEAACRLGEDGSAQDYLNTILKNRFEDGKVPKSYGAELSGQDGQLTQYPQSGSTPSCLLDAILLQRRIELWGEGGRFYEMKRLQEDMFRDAETYQPHIGYKTFSAEDKEKWNFVIPQKEENSNPNINKK